MITHPNYRLDPGFAGRDPLSMRSALYLVLLASCVTRHPGVDGDDAEAERVLAEVEPVHLAQLHELVGRYTLGDALVYAGTFHASDSLGGLMSDGHALAALTAGDNVLTVYRPAERVRVQLSQMPSYYDTGFTRASLVAPYPSAFVEAGTCDACMTDLSGRVRELDVAIDARGPSLEVQAGGRLIRVDPSQVGWEELVTLGMGALDDFVPAGEEMVRTVERELYEVLDDLAGDGCVPCQAVTTYRAEEYVDLSDPTRFGVRELTVESRVETCF